MSPASDLTPLATAAALGLRINPALLLPELLSEVEQQIRDLPYEVSLAFTEHGELQMFKAGETTKITFTDADLDRLSGCHFTHNHPQRGFLSVHDIVFAHQHDLLQMRAVAGSTVHVLGRPAAGWQLSVCQTLFETELRRMRKAFGSPNANLPKAQRMWNAFAEKLVHQLSLPLSQEML